MKVDSLDPSLRKGKVKRGAGGGVATLVASVLCLSLLAAPSSAGAAGLDPAFGQAGISMTPLETAVRTGVGLAVGADGSAIVGQANGYLVRFGPEGTQDPGFGEGGKLSLLPDPIAEGVAERALFLDDFTVDGAGRLVMFGRQSDARHAYPIPYTTENQVATESEAVVLRFDREGKLDPSFGAGRGFVRSSFGVRSKLGTKMPLTAAIAGAVDFKNRPVLAVGAAAIELGCNAGAVTYYPHGVVRLTEAGTVERSFGEKGLAPIVGSTGVPGFGIDAAGRPALGLGHYLHPELNCRPGTALGRLRANGKRVGNFGSDGAASLNRNLNFDFVTPSGTIVLSHRSGRTLQVVRVGLSGRPDSGFGEVGTANVRLPAEAGAELRPVGVDTKGRIVLAGFTGRGGPFPVLNSKNAKPSALAVGRLLADGRLDRSFGKGGWILDRVPGTVEVGASAATIDPQGRLLVAATVTAPGQHEGGYLLDRFLLGP
jgi:hypothetical protein